MKKLSLFQIIFLAVFGSLAVSGVGIFAFVVGNTSSGGIGAVTVWGTLNESAFSTVIRQLGDQDNRFKQVTYVQKDPATYEQELTNALASGSGPDLFILRSDYAAKDGPKILPIPYETFSKEQFRSTFVEAADPLLSESGVLAVPLAADPLVLYWNRDLAASAGFSNPPAYWPELLPFAQAVTKRDQTKSVVKSAIAFGEYANVMNAKDILAMLLLQAGIPITTRDSTGRLITALVVKSGDAQQRSEQALHFYTSFADPSKEYYSWNRSRPSSREAFTAGDLALYIGYASEEPLIHRMNPNLNYGATSTPQISKDTRFIVGSRVYAFAVPRAAKNSQGALTIAYLLTSTDASKMLSVALGMPSARRDVLSAAAQGNDALFNKQAIIGRSWIDPDTEKTETIFRDMIESVTSGASTVSEAVQRADQAMTQLLSL